MPHLALVVPPKVDPQLPCRSAGPAASSLPPCLLHMLDKGSPLTSGFALARQGT